MERQYPLNVMDEGGTVLGDQFADLFTANCLIAEIKACRSQAEEHVAQIAGCFRA